MWEEGMIIMSESPILVFQDYIANFWVKTKEFISMTKDQNLGHSSLRRNRICWRTQMGWIIFKLEELYSGKNLGECINNQTIASIQIVNLDDVER